MTAINASNLLYEWFLDHDSFSLKDDFLKLVKLSDKEDSDKAAILSALKNYKVLSIIDSDDNVLWVLKAPIKSFPQTINISAYTASAISRTINTFAEEKVIETNHISNPAVIGEVDIVALLEIIDNLIGLVTKGDE